MEPRMITTPLTDDLLPALRAGDPVRLSGTIYTARDAAHKRLVALLGPASRCPSTCRARSSTTPAPRRPPGNAIGSPGPTTSGRMDAYAPLLMAGRQGMIGKGPRTRGHGRP